MNTRNLAMLAILGLALTACKKDDDDPAPTPAPTPTTASMRMQFNFVHGGNAFEIIADYTDAAGHSIRFSALKF